MLDKVKSFFSQVASNKKYIVIIILAMIFLVAAVYTFKFYVYPKTKPKYVANKEFITESSEEKVSKADLYFFYTEWCPHCKTAKPIWNKLKEEIGDNKVKDVEINFIEVDCDKEADTASKYKVEGYPTIKLMVGDKIIDYDAKPELDTLKQFLDTSL